MYIPVMAVTGTFTFVVGLITLAVVVYQGRRRRKRWAPTDGSKAAWSRAVAEQGQTDRATREKKGCQDAYEKASKQIGAAALGGFFYAEVAIGNDDHREYVAARLRADGYQVTPHTLVFLHVRW